MTACRLHHAIAGPRDGRPVLFGGSLGTTLGMWDPQVARLAVHRRVVAFDHRGHGGSPVPKGPYAIDDLGGDVLALLDRLGIERASYCGLSIGGMVGMWLAINAPERIDHLVLMCTAAHLPPASMWRDRAAAVREAGTPEVIADTIFSRWLTASFIAERPEVAGRIRGMFDSTSAEGYAGCCEAIEAMDLRPDLGKISAPTLVIAADEDPSTPPKHGKVIAHAIDGARLEIVPHAAHLASVERPDVVTQLIADHLDDQEAA